MDDTHKKFCNGRTTKSKGGGGMNSYKICRGYAKKEYLRLYAKKKTFRYKKQYFVKSGHIHIRRQYFISYICIFLVQECNLF